MRATWDSSRLWALIPSAGGDIAGKAVTPAFDAAAVQGKKLVLNLRVHNQTRSKTNGYILVELLDATEGHAQKGKGTVIPGFSLADCTPVSPASGEDKQAVVSWKGGAVVPPGHPSVKVRFVLMRARMYSYRWQ
jgi:hypothetical protein